MATFLELQNRVKERVIDLPPTVLARVPVLVNHAVRELQRLHNYRAMETSAVFVTNGTLTPTPNTITKFKEYRDKGPYLLSQLTKAKRYITASQQNADMALLADPDVPTEPQFLIDAINPLTGVATFTLHPYPDTNSDWDDGNYRIIVPAYRYLDDLVADADSNWFTLFADDFIELYAAAEGFGLDWDYNSMGLLMQDAENKRKVIERADKMVRMGSVDTLVPMWKGANQPQVRR